MAQLVGIRLQQDPVMEEHGDGDQMQAEEEAAAAKVGSLPPGSNNLHAMKPLKAVVHDRQLQHGPDVAKGRSSYHNHPPRRRAVDSAAYRDPDDAGRRPVPPAAEGPKRSWHSTSSLGKPFSAIHKLLLKVSKAVKGVSPGVINMNQEDPGQHFYVYHHHHHHYHHHLRSLHEEDCDTPNPGETYAIPRRRRRFSDSSPAAAAVHTAKAVGPQGQSEERASGKWWELYDQADCESPFVAPCEIKSGAATKLSRGHANNIGISSGLRGVNNDEKRLSKTVSLQTGSAKDAETKSVPSSAFRLRRLSDSLSDREAALRQFDLARVCMGDGDDKQCKHASSVAAGGAASRRRHSASFSKYCNIPAA